MRTVLVVVGVVGRTTSVAVDDVGTTTTRQRQRARDWWGASSTGELLGLVLSALESPSWHHACGLSGSASAVAGNHCDTASLAVGVVGRIVAVRDHVAHSLFLLLLLLLQAYYCLWRCGSGLQIDRKPSPRRTQLVQWKYTRTQQAPRASKTTTTKERYNSPDEGGSGGKRLRRTTPHYYYCCRCCSID